MKKKVTELYLNSSSWAPFIYDCLIALAPNKEILQFPVKGKNSIE